MMRLEMVEVQSMDEEPRINQSISVLPRQKPIMLSITPLILSFNEQENIGRTLSVLHWAQEVVLIDSFSTDATLEIAQASHPNVRVVQRHFDNHTAQWNFGVDQVQTPWVLSLDADYELSTELVQEVQLLEPPSEVSGYLARFRFRVFGRKLRGTVYPPRVVLFRRNQARYRDDGHTQLLHTDGHVLSLKGVIYHDDRKPLSRWLQSQDRYMLIEAPHLLNPSATKLSHPDKLRRGGIFAPIFMFLYLLFACGLILDGWPGWYYVLQRTLAEMLLALRVITVREQLELKS